MAQANSDDVPSTPGAEGADGEASEPATPKVMFCADFLGLNMLSWRCYRLGPMLRVSIYVCAAVGI